MSDSDFARTPWRCGKPDKDLSVRVYDKNNREILVCEATVGAYVVKCVNADKRQADRQTAIRTVIDVLSMPRDRLGRLEASTPEAVAAREALRNLAVAYKTDGAKDSMDQAAKVLTAVLNR